MRCPLGTSTPNTVPLVGALECKQVSAMNFQIDLMLALGDNHLRIAEVLANLDALRSQHHEDLSDLGSIEGVITIISKPSEDSLLDEPVVRLMADWIRKVRWVVGGDTETVALRNSEHCFGFEPNEKTLEVSLFVGAESEIETYLVEPQGGLLINYAKESIEMGERLIELLKALDSDFVKKDEDCLDLITSLDEARVALKEKQSPPRH